ncbi:MAG: hypothetical protein K2J08_09500 [Ruminococcus sp.]|nr:hypothetical protein [Ruminococcus sp.]
MKNNIISAIVAGILLATTFSYHVAKAESLKKGDVNGDGRVDSVDSSITLAEYSLMSTDGKTSFTEEQKISADVNNDGFINSVDASMILAYYAEASTGGNPAWENKNIDYSDYYQAVQILASVDDNTKYGIADLDGDMIFELITLTDGEISVFSIENGEMVVSDVELSEDSLPQMYYCSDMTAVEKLM